MPNNRKLAVLVWIKYDKIRTNLDMYDTLWIVYGYSGGFQYYNILPWYWPLHRTQAISPRPNPTLGWWGPNVGHKFSLRLYWVA